MALWDRQEGESINAFAAFSLYRDMGPYGEDRRSIRDVAERVGKNKRTVGNWASQHNWVMRAEAWDKHLDELRQREAEKYARDMVNRLMKTGEAYAGMFAQRLTKQARGELGAGEEEIPLNAPGFVAVSKLLVELANIEEALQNPDAARTLSGQPQRAALTAEELVAATKQIATNGRDVTPRDAILTALANKYGADRLALAEPKKIVDAEVVDEEDGE